MPLRQRGGQPIPPRWPHLRWLSASSLLITVMASTPPQCPVLPDGRALTTAFVGMDEDRFSSMSADNVQVLCASGSDCKVQPRAGPVDLSIHRCMNCSLKFHSLHNLPWCAIFRLDLRCIKSLREMVAAATAMVAAAATTINYKLKQLWW